MKKKTKDKEQKIEKNPFYKNNAGQVKEIPFEVLTESVSSQIEKEPDEKVDDS